METEIIHRNVTGIYQIVNLVNGKRYVGKALCIYRRIKDHITRLNKKSKDENPHLINAWHKYGRKNFKYEILEIITENKDVLCKERELHWMDQLKSHDRKYGYNLRKDTSTGLICSQETKNKLSHQTKLRYINDSKAKEKQSNALKAHWISMSKEQKEIQFQNLSKSLRTKRIAKCNNEDKILEIFEFRKDIQKAYPEYYIQAILGCCNGDKKSYKGFHWHYVELNSDKLLIKSKK